MVKTLLAGAVIVTFAASATAPSLQLAARTVADSVLDARVARVASGLRCPVCQGLSIQDSPSELAQQMRALVRDQLAQGRTEDEVREYFISKYGEFILLEPRPRGFNIVAYLLPAAALILGGAVIVGAVRKWTAPPPTQQ